MSNHLPSARTDAGTKDAPGEGSVHLDSWEGKTLWLVLGLDREAGSHPRRGFFFLNSYFILFVLGFVWVCFIHLIKKKYLINPELITPEAV